MSFFKKLARGASKVFNKVKDGVSKTFKKGGYLQQGLNAVGNVANKVVSVGGKVVDAVERSPFGAALAPLTSAARTGLNLAGRAAGIAKVSGNALADAQQSVKNREGVGKIVGNVLEKAKEAEMVARDKGPKFA